jgi:hypothetical protein
MAETPTCVFGINGCVLEGEDREKCTTFRWRSSRPAINGPSSHYRHLSQGGGEEIGGPPPEGFL